MNIVANIQEIRIKEIEVTADTISAHFYDGRAISIPLAWSWRLAEATIKQRQNFEIVGDGHSIHWEDIDEDLSAEGFIYGVPAPRPANK